jgi:ornithine cyclodeaminase
VSLETIQGTLAQLCRGERPGRRSAGERTVFKAVGSALEDLAAATRAWHGEGRRTGV